MTFGQLATLGKRAKVGLGKVTKMKKGEGSRMSCAGASCHAGDIHPLNKDELWNMSLSTLHDKYTKI